MASLPGATGGSVRRTATRLLLVAGLMFGFGFALVPLYDVFCDLTGLNGKTDGVRHEYRESARAVDEMRTVGVQFVAINNESVSWEFEPNLGAAEMHPGDVIQTSYRARNTSGRDMTVQAVPSISPGYAAKYVRKFECFCFERQHLARHEERDMPLRFELSSDIPDKVGRITLSYTLFDVTEANVN